MSGESKDAQHSATPDSSGNSKRDHQAGASSTTQKQASAVTAATATAFGTIMAFQPSADMKKFAKKYRTEIAASSSSVLSTFTAYPLDFAKSRMQSYDTRFIPTVIDAYRAEGLRAFWRGVFPPMITVTAVRTISFSLYQRAKYACDSWMVKLGFESPLARANKPGSYPTLGTITCFGFAGAAAGALITTLSCPFELTKLNAQLAGKMAREASLKSGVHVGDGKLAATHFKSLNVNTNAWVVAKQLVRDRGPTGLYCGYRLHLLRDTIGTSIYFMTYESVKQMLANARGKSPTSPYAVMVAGGLCGIVSWACIYPVDIAKTVYQKSLLGAGSGHAERPKIKFFKFQSYRGTAPSSAGNPLTTPFSITSTYPTAGLGVSVLRSCLINMIFFSNFEMVKKRINSLDV